MNRLTELFKKKKSNVLSVFYTAGFPTLNDTPRIATYLQNAGADIIEIGIPFSDPVADGPVIQQSNKIALDNGMSIKLLLDQVKEVRENVSIPVILMGYLNPVLQYGVEKFCKDAATAGVDGVILPDLPMREYLNDYKKIFHDHNLLPSFLISPTTSEERIKEIDAVTEGFIYAVSASSTTGTREGFTEDQVKYFKFLHDMKLKNPFLVGFGISNKQSFEVVCRYASGAIVGSAFIRALQESKDIESDVNQFVKILKGK